MHFLKTLAVGALAFANLAIAQTQLAFTDVPGQVTAGQAVVLKYTAQDLTQPATITLRKGDPANLDTIYVITTSALSGTYTWIPSPSLANASDYALMITLGSEVNYSARFDLIGSSPSAVSSANAATSSALSAGAALTSSASVSSLASSLSSVIASYNSSLANLTATPSGNATVIIPPSLGTGSPLTRNATLTSATLTSATLTSATLTSQSSVASTSAAATTTKTGGSTSSSAAAATATTGAAATLKCVEVSGFALLLVGVVFFLQ